MIQVLSVVFSIAFLVVTVYVVRSRELHFSYAGLWLALSTVVLILALNVSFWNRLAHALGVYYAPALIFLVAILFVMVYLFRLTVTVTRLTKQNTRLAQDLGMLKALNTTSASNKDSWQTTIAHLTDLSEDKSPGISPDSVPTT